jgi:hypothetical protein
MDEQRSAPQSLEQTVAASGGYVTNSSVEAKQNVDFPRAHVARTPTATIAGVPGGGQAWRIHPDRCAVVVLARIPAGQDGEADQ